MKTRPFFIVPVILALLTLYSPCPTAHAQGTVFTYQGVLSNKGAPVSGTNTLSFALYNASSGGTLVGVPITNSAVVISNGLFTVALDFGSGTFLGAATWLQLALETNSAGNFISLAPRQQLTPAPYAIYAATAGTVPALSSSGYQNFFAAQNAGNSTLTGQYNTGVGDGALSSVSTGSFDTATGVGALGLNSTGSNNAAFGSDALAFNQNASDNTAVGADALGLNSGSYNTALGTSALQSSSGGGNTAIGAETLTFNAGGYNNTAEGYAAIQNLSGGIDNVAIGVAAFQGISAGNQNTAVGTYAFQYLTAGNANIGLGYNAGYNLNAGTNNIYIGNSGGSAENGVIRIGTPGTQTLTYIAGTIQSPSVTTLTITGGSDLAEPFKITAQAGDVPQGAVVVIDDKNPGQLKLTDQPYDTRVAGVVSGANGIHPGIQMHQQGLLEGGKNVALTGRVYVMADAANGPIKPGDLLTTSSTPGEAMKVTDHVRAQGAILGKAMTSLAHGRGLVLVLVTLQ
jgi:hypothetical protein